ncbi:unnamed protein product [Fraxinus pennsylvanica]|uniref:Uncharacterized protein n=1 Tax=Fraxinus pennsylvanica TaxID=56036 RepID=A0AAD2DRP3_9LAMI|nr:unnamed protein product [Fraxinus pennsylvanica]
MSHTPISKPVNPKSSFSAPPLPPFPSPFTSRAKPSPDRGSDKKKSPAEKSFLDESSLKNPDLNLFLLKVLLKLSTVVLMCVILIAFLVVIMAIATSKLFHNEMPVD